MIIVFVFFDFLFFKILSSAMFDNSLTIWASALIAIVVGIITGLSGILGSVFAFQENGGLPKLAPKRVIAIIIGASIASSFTGYLIAMGFSDRLFRDISRWNLSRYTDFWEQDLFWFCIMISIPVISQLGFFFWRLSKYQ